MQHENNELPCELFDDSGRLGSYNCRFTRISHVQTERHFGGQVYAHELPPFTRVVVELRDQGMQFTEREGDYFTLVRSNGERHIVCLINAGTSADFGIVSTL